MNDNKGVVDKFLDSYDNYNTKKNSTQLITVYVRPTKFKSIVGFLFSLIMFVLLLTMFSFNLIYFLMLFGSLGVAVYYGINLFTPNGIGIPKTIEVPIEEIQKNESNSMEFDEDEIVEKSDKYKVQ